MYPNFALAHEVFADLILVEGQFEEAIKCYQQSLQLDPGRSALQKKIDRAQQLIATGEAVTTGPRQVMAYADEMARATQFSLAGEVEKSEKIYRDILRRDPNHVEAMRLLATIASTHREYADAELLLQRAVKRAPEYSRAWLDLSLAQKEQEKNVESLKSSEQVVKLTPEFAESHIALANARARVDLSDEAIESYRSALEIAPKHPGAFSGLAHQLKTIGRQEEAIAAHRQNIETNPRNAEPYWNLANLKTFRFEDHEVKAMQDLLDGEALDDLSVVQLCNALGLEFEGRKDYGMAFDYFKRCNTARRKSETYDPIANELTTEQLIEIFSDDFCRKHEGNGNPDAAPILIVGLPRSGSTLIEQILASHSLVEGTHELSDLSRLVRSIAKKMSENQAQARHFPELLKGFGQQAWARFGKQYIQSTQKYRSDLPHFIDKNPNNFIYAGLMHMALPNAKIINARRHPLDSCFGSYKQLFASGQPFSYDLTELGEYYLQYEALMEHWHQVIPGKVLDVDYEEVVLDLEGQVRRILAHCDLPFEEACLSFHETDRAVKTASSEQVRQPIYSSSVNLWQHYEPHLGELIEILEPLLRQHHSDELPSLLRD